MRKRFLALLLAGAVLAQPWDGKITCALAGAGVFILLALAAPLLDRPWPRAVGAQLAKISYAVFLVHHVLIQELAAHFDLAVLSRRDTAFLFVVYLAATFAAAHALLWLQRTLRTGLAALCPQIQSSARCFHKNSGYFFNLVRPRPLYKNGRVRYNRK